MLSFVVYAAPFVLGLIALIALISAYSNFRLARKAPYFRIRRTAQRTAWKRMLLLALAVAGIFASISLRRFVAPFDLRNYFPSRPDRTATLSLDTLLTGTPASTVTPVPPTITPTQPTPTPTPVPYVVTVASNVTPPANASVTITGVSSGISTNLTPVGLNTTFPAGTPRLYFWLEYANMADGVSWSLVLLLDGEVARTESGAWERGTDGFAYYWFEATGGWPAGHYEVQFYVGDRLAASSTFEVHD